MITLQHNLARKPGLGCLSDSGVKIIHMTKLTLVKLSDHQIKGQNYHWVKRKRFGITLKELEEIGVTDGEGYVCSELIVPLQQANNILKEHGYELFITDAYRKPELYKLAHNKRQVSEGKHATKKLMNMNKQPHATGYTVDATLLSTSNGQPVMLRNNEDGTESAFINYYQNKNDPKSKMYQERQLILRNTMKKVGFKLGIKNEFWHFELDA